jgi:predicted transcriptional regulator
MQQILRRFGKTRDGEINEELISSKHEQLAKALIQLGKMIAKLKKEGEEKRLQIRNIILDERMLTQHSQVWKDLASSMQIVNELLTNPQEFMRKKEEYMQTLKQAGEEELALEVEKINVPNPETVQNLKEVLKTVIAFKRFNNEKRDYEDRLKVIRESTTTVRDRANKFEEKLDESSKNNVELMQRIEGIMTAPELQYLLIYLIDLDGLATLAGRGNLTIEWFIKRVREYREGEGKEMTIRKVPIHGLKSRFSDDTIDKEIENSDAVRNLLTYEEQKVFIKELWELMQSTVHNREWDGEFTKPDGEKVKMPFLGPKGFYNNLTKGHKFIKMVRNHYGNHAFADELETVREKAGERPVLFEREMKRLYGILHNPAFQAKVIMAAVQALHKLFSERLGEIEKEQQSELRTTLKDLAKLIRELGDVESVGKGLKKKVTSKRKLIFRDWIKMKKEFALSEKEIGIKFSVFIEGCNNIYEQLENVAEGDPVNEALQLEESLLPAIKSDLSQIGIHEENFRVDDAPKFTGASLMAMGLMLDESRFKLHRIRSEIEENADTIVEEIHMKLEEAEELISKYNLLLNERDKLFHVLRINREDVEEIKIEGHTLENSEEVLHND